MKEKKRINYTKKDISKNLSIKTGLSNSYSLSIIDNLIEILKQLIAPKLQILKILEHLKFYLKMKDWDEILRTIQYIISARKTLSFISIKKINEKMNN